MNGRWLAPWSRSGRRTLRRPRRAMAGAARPQLHRGRALPDRLRGPLPLRHRQPRRLSLTQPLQRLVPCQHPLLRVRSRDRQPGRDPDVLHPRPADPARPNPAVDLGPPAHLGGLEPVTLTRIAQTVLLAVRSRTPQSLRGMSATVVQPHLRVTGAPRRSGVTTGSQIPGYVPDPCGTRWTLPCARRIQGGILRHAPDGHGRSSGGLLTARFTVVVELERRRRPRASVRPIGAWPT